MKLLLKALTVTRASSLSYAAKFICMLATSAKPLATEPGADINTSILCDLSSTYKPSPGH